jgi:predicted GH43/DUF377 family glycosyl hydrolase
MSLPSSMRHAQTHSVILQSLEGSIYSDDLFSWDGGLAILKPQFPWEFVQIGNCGSPIELDNGWLLLTHGVGPVRKYSIGAVLLDKGDPSKVLARSREPQVRPQPS